MRRLVAAVVLALAGVAGRLVDAAITVAERELEAAEVGYCDGEGDDDPLPPDLQEVADLLWLAAHGAPPITQDPIALHFRDHRSTVDGCRLCAVTHQEDDE